MNYTPNYTGATSDTQLFSVTGNGGVSQLTGNSALSDGWVWSGGLLFQWGRFTPASTATLSGIITFKDRGPGSQGIPFPNNIFIVNLTYSRPSISLSAVACVDSTTPPIPTQFKWRTNGIDTPVYWFAIGN